MKKYIRIAVIFLMLAALFIVSCEEEPVYHYAHATDDVAAMGTVEENTKGNASSNSSSNSSNSNINTGGKMRVAITYDDGPHNVYTKKIVDELEKYNFSATFFVLGNRVDGTDYKGASALKYAYEKGNEIGIHGYTHEPYYDSCSNSVYSDEINNTAKAIKDELGSAKLRLMRPTYGKISDERVKQSKYFVILWSVDSEDWRHKYALDGSDSARDKEQKVQAIVDNVMNSVSDGDIILMHDIYESTYDASVIILKRLYQEGYEVVSVSELMGSDLVSGKRISQKGN